MSKTKRKKKVATLMGHPIENSCPCGDVVSKYERQEVVFDVKAKKWFRVCKECLEQDRSFDGK